MRVRILPATVADQIAAGEVVERAASVVKELCENALDAGATRVDVEIEGGGRRLVRVIDDGSGMEREDAVMALRRHATSKIQSVDDLWGLHSFGFRGEALPSIAAVSRMSLLTKSREGSSAGGLRLDIEGGQLMRETEVGMPNGTQIEVRDLFFNTPARLKFQKTEATEAGNVTEAVVRLALAHEGVHFRLRTAGRVTLDLPAHRSRAERVRAALARRGAGVLQEATGSSYGVNVQAFLAAPEEASTAARSTFLFVGARFVRDRSLLHALSLGYGDLLEKGRYPLAVLFVEVPGQELDINVHPQKLEVRFARSQEVYAAVREVVAAALARAPWQSYRRAHSLPPEPALDEPPAWMGGGTARGEGETGRDVAGEARGRWQGGTGGGGGGWARPAGFTGYGGGRGGEPARSFSPSLASSFSPSLGSSFSPSFSPSRASASALEGAGWREVGVVHGCGLLLETAEGVVLLDGHVLLAEAVRAALETQEASLPSHRLLFPLPIVAGVPEEERSEVQATLQKLGFVVDGWTGAELTLAGLPAVTGEADPKPLLLDVLAALARGAGDTDESVYLRAVGVLACYATDDAASRLPEIREALQGHDLGVVGAICCAHGRALVQTLPWRDVEPR